MILWTALLLGLAGSLHCVGMCGPLAAAVHGATGSYRATVFYQAGKLLTYMVLGSIAGVLGKLLLSHITGAMLSVLTGSMLLAFVLASFFAGRHRGYTPFNRFFDSVRKKMALSLHRKGWKASALFGMLNGLLPCGLVYWALTASLCMGSPLGSVAYMAAFGLGTMPALLAVAIGTGYLKNVSFFKKNISYLTVFIALVLIMRGLNLGIPLISPKIESEKNGKVTSSCCKQKKIEK